nr:endonuclease V [Acinetobacter sp. HY1485]
MVFENVESQKPVQIYTKIIDDIALYEPGAFYKRELPCILSLFETILEPSTTVVVDGYVHLGADQKDGLGMYLYKQVHLPVIGVEKNYFKETPKECELYRGTSQKPIYVTAVGYP